MARRGTWRALGRASALTLSLVLASACGYTFGAPGGGVARSVHVAPIREVGLDVDAAALVGRAVRQAIARGPGTRLVAEGPADARLEVELVGAPSALQPFADLSARAAQYRQVVSLRGALYAATGEVLWRSEVVTGEAPYLSPPGGVEALEGARRRALARAAEDAADRLVASLRWREVDAPAKPNATP